MVPLKVVLSAPIIWSINSFKVKFMAIVVILTHPKIFLLILAFVMLIVLFTPLA